MTSAPAKRSAPTLLSEATSCLARVAEEENIPGNLEAALLDILIAAFNRDGSDVRLENIHACVAALAAAEPALLAHYSDTPTPVSIGLGLRCAGAIAQLVGVPVDEWTTQAKHFAPGWADHVGILLAEIEIAECKRRLAARLGPELGAEPASSSCTLH